MNVLKVGTAHLENQPPWRHSSMGTFLWSLACPVRGFLFPPGRHVFLQAQLGFKADSFHLLCLCFMLLTLTFSMVPKKSCSMRLGNAHSSVVK